MLTTHLSIETLVEEFIQKAWTLRLGNAKEATHYAYEALRIAQDAGYKLGIGRSTVLVAFFSSAQNSIGNAIPLLDEALTIFDELENDYEKSITYVLRGNSYLQIGDYDKGFEDMLKGLEYAKKHQHDQALAVGNYLLGAYYIESKDLALADDHYQSSLVYFRQIKDLSGEATVIAGLGNIATARQDYEQALQNHYKSLEISRQIENSQVEARNLHDLGVVYEQIGYYAKALAYINQSLEIRRSRKNIQGIITSQTSLGRIYGSMGDYTEAIRHVQEAVAYSQEVNALPKLVKAYRVLADLYKKNQQPWEAMEALEKYIEFKNLVAGEESNAKLKAILAVNQSEQDRQEAEIHKLRNIELKKAYQKIEDQNQHIIDSIKYARRIQEAMLPPQYELAQYAEKAFIFYRPKDIVSGDFYWFGMSQGRMILASVDCTGHGVPGAFMVVMGISLLEEIVNELHINEPQEILKRLDVKIRQALKQDQTDTHNTQDGMDLSIVSFCPNHQKLSFAGARSSLFYVREGVLREVKGSVFPIGSSQYNREKDYEQFELDILPDDVFYMATDGFRDQFGGAENKKYTKPRFRELLQSISHLKMPAQEAYLAQEFDNWKGNYTQTDDVLVMGFKTSL